VKVDFIIVGAQKCGTTTLFDILNTHPGLVGSQPKEPHFFTAPAARRRPLEDYEGIFSPQAPGLKYFEASTSYTFYPMRGLHIWDAIHDYNPEMKLIYLVRNPIDRVVSGFVHVQQRSKVERDFEETIRGGSGHLDITRYYTQIAPYVRKFGRDQVLILDFDDLVDDRAALLQSVASFIGVDFDEFSDYGAVHSNAAGSSEILLQRHSNPSLPYRAIRRYLPSLWRRITDNTERTSRPRPVPSEETREMILNVLDADIRALEELMGADLSKWR